MIIKLGIPANLVRMMKTCMQNSRCKIKFNTIISEEFTVTTGVKQDDALSPVLFNFALESVVREIQKSKLGGLNIGQGKQLILTAYAGDIAVIAESENYLKRTTKRLIDVAKRINLAINEDKIKFIIIFKNNYPQTSIAIKDMPFENVHK